MKKGLGFAIILLLSLLIGGGITFYAYTQPQIKLNPVFDSNALTTTSQINKEIQQDLLSVINDFEGVGSSLKSTVRNAFLYGLKGDGQGVYYHNPSVSGEPPGFGKDVQYNQEISKDAASVFFLPSAFGDDYRQTYEQAETETENPFSHLRDPVYEDFNRSSLLFPIMELNQREDISFMRYASSEGYIITYPYVSYEKDYDFTKDAWYQSGLIGAKDIVIAIDTSGSLNVTHFEAIKNATNQIISDLAPTDRFSIVAFSDRISKLSSRLLVATESNKDLAKNFIDRLRLGGLSDLSGGTTEALSIISNFGYRRNERILITLTDGFANSGVLTNESLAETINKENGVAEAKIVYYGVNDKVNIPLLSFLENETSGIFELTNSSDLILQQIPNYASLLGNPTTEFITWGAPRIDTTMNRIEVNISMSIVVQDRVVGVLDLEVDLEPFLNVLKDNLRFSTQESFVVTVGRSTFAHLDYSSIDLRAASPSDVPLPLDEVLFDSPDLDSSLRSFLRGSFSSGQIIDSDGRIIFLSLASLGQTGLTIGTTIPRDTLIPNSAVEKLKGPQISLDLFSGMYPVFGIAIFSAFVMLLLRRRLFPEVDEQ